MGPGEDEGSYESHTCDRITQPTESTTDEQLITENYFQ